MVSRELAGRRDDGGLSDRLARLPEGHPSALDADADPRRCGPWPRPISPTGGGRAAAELAAAELADELWR